MTTEMGSMREVPGGVELRYERWMKHSPAKVWRALTQNDGLQAWFPTSIEGEWVVGGRLHFVFHGQHADSQPADVQALDESQYWGEVFEVDEPHRLSYSWFHDTLTFDLAERDGGCLLVFTTVLSERDHVCRTAAGWHECLDILTAHESDQPWTLPPNARWSEVHPAYERAFGADPEPHVVNSD